MITLRALFKTTCSITRLEIDARAADLHLLHKFWIGANCNREHLPHGMLRDWSSNKITLCDHPINVHGQSKRGGDIEIAWGLKNGSVPKEILDAEVWMLGMRSERSDGAYTVWADIILTEMEVEMLKTILGKEAA